VDKDTTVVHVEVSATSAAGFKITRQNPTLYKREVGKADEVITAEVVQP
jgi:hypothetical protein